MEEPRILFGDEHLIVAVKPYGVLSEDSEQAPCLPALLREHTGGDIYPVHRLDRTTHGVMVYARTAPAAAFLSEAVRTGRMLKEYRAVVEGLTDEGGELTDLLYYDRTRSKSFVVKRERRGVKEARLCYERLAAGEFGGAPVSLLRVRLFTGRTHQIRVQFASRRHPLVGDRRYGSKVPADHIALCACAFRFPHPATGEEMCFSCEPEGEVFRSLSEGDLS